MLELSKELQQLKEQLQAKGDELFKVLVESRQQKEEIHKFNNRLQQRDETIKELKEALNQSLEMIHGFKSYLRTLDYKDWTEKEKALCAQSEVLEDKARKLTEVSK